MAHSESSVLKQCARDEGEGGGEGGHFWAVVSASSTKARGFSTSTHTMVENTVLQAFSPIKG